MAEPLSVAVRIRLSQAQREKLRALAALNQQTLNGFIRDAIDAAAADCSDDCVF